MAVRKKPDRRQIFRIAVAVGWVMIGQRVNGRNADQIRHQEWSQMKIAIVGAGNVGGTLGRGWAQRGHEIIFGVRDAKDARIKKVLVSTGMNSSATSIAEAAGTADIIVLSVPWPAEGAVKSCGNLTGKILVDCTNPLKPDLTGLALGHNTSAADQR